MPRPCKPFSTADARTILWLVADGRGTVREIEEYLNSDREPQNFLSSHMVEALLRSIERQERDNKLSVGHWATILGELVAAEGPELAETLQKLTLRRIKQEVSSLKDLKAIHSADSGASCETACPTPKEKASNRGKPLSGQEIQKVMRLCLEPEDGNPASVSDIMEVINDGREAKDYLGKQSIYRLRRSILTQERVQEQSKEHWGRVLSTLVEETAPHLCETWEKLSTRERKGIMSLEALVRLHARATLGEENFIVEDDEDTSQSHRGLSQESAEPQPGTIVSQSVEQEHPTERRTFPTEESRPKKRTKRNTLQRTEALLNNRKAARSRRRRQMRMRVTENDETDDDMSILDKHDERVEQGASEVDSLDHDPGIRRFYLSEYQGRVKLTENCCCIISAVVASYYLVYGNGMNNDQTINQCMGRWSRKAIAQARKKFRGNSLIDCVDALEIVQDQVWPEYGLSRTQNFCDTQAFEITWDNLLDVLHQMLEATDLQNKRVSATFFCCKHQVAILRFPDPNEGRLYCYQVIDSLPKEYGCDGNAERIGGSRVKCNDLEALRRFLISQWHKAGGRVSSTHVPLSDNGNLAKMAKSPQIGVLSVFACKSSSAP